MSQTTLPCFDDLLVLASQYPEQLEQLRSRLTQEILDSTEDQAMRKRLEQLVFRINAERCRHSNPLSLCIHFSRLMHNGLYHMQHELEKLVSTNRVYSIHPAGPVKIEHQGQVIQLSSYRKLDA